MYTFFSPNIINPKKFGQCFDIQIEKMKCVAMIAVAPYHGAPGSNSVQNVNTELLKYFG